MSEMKSELYTYSLEMISVIEEIRALGVNPKQEGRLMQLEGIAKNLKRLYESM